MEIRVNDLVFVNGKTQCSFSLSLSISQSRASVSKVK